MKIQIPVIILLLFPSAIFANVHVEVVMLKEAISSGKIEASYNYFRKGKEHKRVVITATCKKNEPFKVCIPSGTYFQSENEGWQNHIVTKSDTFLVLPKIFTHKALSAFCCESGDGVPAKGSQFSLIKNPNLKSIELCKLIDSLQDYTYSAQRAIWQLFNKKNPNAIVGKDSLTVMALRSFVGKALDLEVDVYHTNSYVKKVRVFSRSPVEFHKSGVFKLNNIDAYDKIEIQLYSAESDELIKNILHKSMLVQESTLCLFMHDIKIEGLQPYNDYIVRISKNGVVQKEWLYETS